MTPRQQILLDKIHSIIEHKRASHIAPAAAIDIDLAHFFGTSLLGINTQLQPLLANHTLCASPCLNYTLYTLPDNHSAKGIDDKGDIVDIGNS